MIPQDILTQVSRLCWDTGTKLLQGYRLAETEAGHIKQLLAYMAPKPDTTWLDIGCGFGEAARLMRAQRPDLKFLLLNNNEFQLSHTPPGFRAIEADMQNIPLGDGAVDGCMFLYSLCHADSFYQALREAARVTQPGGALFVYDYERLRGANDLMLQRLHAQALPFATLRDIARRCGWTVTLHEHPDGDDAVFRSLCTNTSDRVAYTLIFDDLVPVVWRATRA